MASKCVRFIQDQNLDVSGPPCLTRIPFVGWSLHSPTRTRHCWSFLNFHADGASVAGKGDAFKSTKKGGLGGRKPLGDLSNRGKPDFTKASKKPALTNVLEIIADASNKKGLSIASDKVQTHGSHEELSDVSNTVRPPLQKTSSVTADESSCDFEEEGFLHGRKQCIKETREANQRDQTDIFGMMHTNPSKILSSPPKDSQFTKDEEDSLTMYLEEIPEDSSFSSPPWNSPPLSPVPCTDSPCISEECDLQVTETP